jgi:hypothetical protein
MKVHLILKRANYLVEKVFSEKLQVAKREKGGK